VFSVEFGNDENCSVDTAAGVMNIKRSTTKPTVYLDFSGTRSQGYLTLDAFSGPSNYGTYLSFHDAADTEIVKFYLRSSTAMQIWTNGVELARAGLSNGGKNSWRFFWDNGVFKLNKYNHSAATTYEKSYDVGSTDIAYFRIYQPLAGSSPFSIDWLSLNLPPSTPASLYATWANLFDLSGGNEAFDADPDKDNRDNLAEYAIGGNPTNSNDGAVLPSTSTVEDGGVDYFEYIYRRRNDAVARGLSYEVQNSASLTLPAWTNDYVEIDAGPIDSAFDSVTNRIPMTGKSKEFTQLIIESN
jgi:hypothetical protein